MSGARSEATGRGESVGSARRSEARYLEDFEVGAVYHHRLGRTLTDADNVWWEEIRLPHPVYVGDTLRAESVVLGARESESHSDAGVVTVRTRGFNQNGAVCIDFIRSALIYKQGHGPTQQGYAMPAALTPATHGLKWVAGRERK